MVQQSTTQPSRQEDAAPMSYADESILTGFPIIGNPMDVGQALGIPASSVRQLCRTGELRAFKCGSLWRIPKSWLLEYIEGGNCNA